MDYFSTRVDPGVSGDPGDTVCELVLGSVGI